ncbi:MAG TPA: hypothetical protein VFO28_03875 [Burkholderiaceae bacterium]|nr:hypothetical protein [Burkholderiaceae bacterium]
MMRLLMWVLVGLALGPVSAQVQTPSDAASAVSPPAKRLNTTPAPENPTVRASKQAQIPGDLRPQRQTVQQIRIPLGKSGSGGGSGGGIDDSVARCRAKVTSEAREACEAGLDNW